MKTLTIMVMIIILPRAMKIKKWKDQNIKELDRDYYKPIRTNSDFSGRNNNYIEYMSKGDGYENLSPEEYLNVVRPYLRDLTGIK